MDNEENLRKNNEEIDNYKHKKERKTAYLGQLIRNRRVKLLKLIIEVDKFKKLDWLSSHILFRAAQDRHNIIAEIVANLH